MDFLEIAKSRQSCRAYDRSRPVEREKLLACLEAARPCPLCLQRPTLPFTLVTGKQAEAVGNCTRSLGMNAFTESVPAFVVISEGTLQSDCRCWRKVKGQDYRSVDIGIAAAYFTAEATAQGLATCILGWFEEKKLQTLLHLRVLCAW